MLVNAISLEPLLQLTSNLKFVFILSRRQMLYILGHLLKTRWPPSNFLKCMLWTSLENAISLEPFHQLTSNFIYNVISSKGQTLSILDHLLFNQFNRKVDRKILHSFYLHIKLGCNLLAYLHCCFIIVISVYSRDINLLPEVSVQPISLPYIHTSHFIDKFLSKLSHLHKV